MVRAMINALLAALLLAPAPAAPPAPAPGSLKPLQAPQASAQILADAPADAWGRIADDDLMLITFPDGRQVAIWLATGFAPVHIANIRAIARAGWWDDATIYRVQDNYVTQWGDATEKKPPAAGINLKPPAEYERSAKGRAIIANRFVDAYARVTGYSADGWPLAGNGTRQWLPHCYGMVGVARDMAPDTGTGGDLYTVIGHAPRHLDRNIAVVGRVVDGMEVLSSMPRGHANGLGVYEKESMRVPIGKVAMASDLPAAGRPHFEYLKPASATFARYIDSRANRQPPFFQVPANAADLCNLMPPLRRVPG